MQTFTTPGGHEVTHLPMPDAAYDQLIVFWPNTATLDVPGKEGLTTLTARLPFESFDVNGEAYDFDRFDEELKDAEQSIRLNNMLHGTALALASPAGEGFEPAASIARGVLFSPALAEGDLARVQGEITDALEREERDPGLMAERAMSAFVASTDRRRSALTNRPASVVTSVTAADIERALGEALRARPIVVAAGPAEEATVASAVDTILTDARPSGEAPVAEPIALTNEGRTVFVSAPEAEVAIVLVAFSAPTESAPLSAALTALVGDLNARLTQSLRKELGATYGFGVRSYPLVPGEQILTIGGVVPPERAGEVLDVLRAEIATLREGGVTADELSVIKEAVGQQITQRNAEPGIVAGLAVDYRLRGVDRDLAAMGNEIDALTLDAVSSALPDLLPERATAIVVTPDPSVVQADCVVDEPERAASCPSD